MFVIMPLINDFISVAESFFLCKVLNVCVCASVAGKLENSKIPIFLFEKLVQQGMGVGICVCVCV